ncbi:GNAT family N-acetyltransferase [Robiginitalea sp. SC105]|uniref:GNAT family N-acetyltransferase n=1 Tax=Robiginitalea sp. SC105 TaxID=2762332 RepID=UPI001639CBE4|nr:GNAT family N-acetyltransferase [Robiginitalea sp. SC105]MBC2838148.1 GNAT family N-acetyltransferase [Robiginitalea sp. SC105]
MNYLLENLETDRLRFRKIRETDFPLWLEFFKNPEASKHWVSENEPPNLACEKWYAKQFGRYENNLGGMNALIDRKSGELVGHCGLLIQQVDGTTELEIGYSLLPENWNRGLATEAAKKCMEFAFENRLSESLISIISLTNIPSQKVALKNGLTLDKTTVYKGNPVHIFRITRAEYIQS